MAICLAVTCNQKVACASPIVLSAMHERILHEVVCGFPTRKAWDFAKMPQKRIHFTAFIYAFKSLFD